MKLVKRFIAERPDYIQSLHVDDCPIPVREWEGKPYANVVADCFDCPFNNGIVKDDTVAAEENDIQYVLCPETLSEEQKGDPRLWGWSGDAN